MKLLLDIDEKLFEAVKELTQAKTKKDAIVISMKEYLRNHQRMQLVNMMRNYRHGMTLKQLLKSRRKWKKKS